MKSDGRRKNRERLHDRSKDLLKIIEVGDRPLRLFRELSSGSSFDIEARAFFEEAADRQDRIFARSKFGRFVFGRRLRIL